MLSFPGEAMLAFKEMIAENKANGQKGTCIPRAVPRLFRKGSKMYFGSGDGTAIWLDWLQSLKIIFHQCVISYTCSQSNSDGSVFCSSP